MPDSAHPDRHRKPLELDRETLDRLAARVKLHHADHATRRAKRIAEFEAQIGQLSRRDAETLCAMVLDDPGHLAHWEAQKHLQAITFAVMRAFTADKKAWRPTGPEVAERVDRLLSVDEARDDAPVIVAGMETHVTPSPVVARRLSLTEARAAVARMFGMTSKAVERNHQRYGKIKE